MDDTAGNRTTRFAFISNDATPPRVTDLLVGVEADGVTGHVTFTQTDEGGSGLDPAGLRLAITQEKDGEPAGDPEALWAGVLTDPVGPQDITVDLTGRTPGVWRITLTTRDLRGNTTTHHVALALSHPAVAPPVARTKRVPVIRLAKNLKELNPGLVPVPGASGPAFDMPLDQPLTLEGTLRDSTGTPLVNVEVTMQVPTVEGPVPVEGTPVEGRTASLPLGQLAACTPAASRATAAAQRVREEARRVADAARQRAESVRRAEAAARVASLGGSQPESGRVVLTRFGGRLILGAPLAEGRPVWVVQRSTRWSSV